MSDFKPLHIRWSYSQELAAAPEAVFPLLCPVREYEWIEGWECERVHSVSGVAELDCVLTTDLPGRGKETWLICGYEPNQHIQFAIHGPGRVSRFAISLDEIGDSRSRITFTHRFTGLDARGNEYLAALTPETYAGFMRALSLLLNHFLVTGTVLSREAAMQSLAQR